MNLQKQSIYQRLLKTSGLYLLIIAVLFTACSQKSPQPTPKQQSAQEQQQTEKPPQKLKALETSIEQIISDLDGPSVGIKKEKPKESGQQAQGQSQGGGSQQGSHAQGSQGQGGQQGQAAQQQKTPQPSPKDPWQEISPVINTLHYQWNDFMPDAVKKGADLKIVDNFSNALINLTNTVIGKDRAKILMAANGLYAYIPDLYSLYREKTSPEVKRMRYYMRDAILNASTANWVQADKDVGSLKSSWSLYKNTLNKEQQKDSGKLDFSIYELEKVVKEKNQPLTDIKGRVGLSNIEAMEKSGEKGS